MGVQRKLSVAIAMGTALATFGGCPYSLSGSWEGPCEADGEILVPLPTGEDVWVDVSFGFDLSIDITEQGSHLWGDAEGEYRYSVPGLESEVLVGDLVFDVTGERMNSWAEIGLEGDFPNEGINLQLDGGIYRDVVVGECRVEMVGLMADIDDGEFQLDR